MHRSHEDTIHFFLIFFCRGPIHASAQWKPCSDEIAQLILDGHPNAMRKPEHQAGKPRVINCASAARLRLFQREEESPCFDLFEGDDVTPDSNVIHSWTPKRNKMGCLAGIEPGVDRDSRPAAFPWTSATSLAELAGLNRVSHQSPSYKQHDGSDSGLRDEENTSADIMAQTDCGIHTNNLIVQRLIRGAKMNGAFGIYAFDILQTTNHFIDGHIEISYSSTIETCSPLRSTVAL